MHNSRQMALWRILWAIVPVHKSVHNVCKKRRLMHSYAQGDFIHTVYARVLHKLCTGIVPLSNLDMYIF